MQTSDVTRVAAAQLTAFASGFLTAMGCPSHVAAEVAAHLVDADMTGVFSHGTVRLPQYLEQAQNGLFNPAATPVMTTAEGGAALADGQGGFGVPACRMGAEAAISAARSHGVGTCAVANVGHTGRMGAFAELAAEAGCLGIVTGGGGREEWRQVTPYGGIKGMLPTNPYALSVPGGDNGPVTIDFATSAAAGGKILAAKSAGRDLPPGLIVDAAGAPSTNPDDYSAGGAILPAAGPKGYGMALVAELIGTAMYGTAMTGMNWLVVCIDLSRFRAPDAYRAAAEQCLSELRATPPASGFDRVEIPGERERALKAERAERGIPIPRATIDLMNKAAATLGAASL